jgi:cytochrome c biogenesis protein CcmG/thiol:disulfide interchange protein DsbE
MKRNLLTALVVVAAIALVIVADRAGWLKRAAPGPSEELQITELGNQLDLSPYQGKVVLLNFWATWCSPCLIEIPWMIEFQDKYADQGFTVLGVSMDDEGRAVVEPWLVEHRFDVNGQERPVNYPILVGNEKIGEQFGGIIGLPTTLVIGRDGKTVKRFIGLASHEKLLAEIESLLQGSTEGATSPQSP